MRIVNMSATSEQVKIVLAKKDGTIIQTDYVNVMPKKQVDLPPDFIIEKNWAVLHPHVRQLSNSKEA